MTDWILVEDTRPPEGKLVDTISPGSIEQKLVRKGNLYFYDDFSMYVYYTPEFWREAS